MALKRRSKIIGAVLAVAVVAAGAIGVLAVTGHVSALGDLGKIFKDEPPTCQTTGEALAEGQEAPSRPVLGIKVENTPDARPLVGLNKADIVYEEVVEGGITRFIAIYNCKGSQRVGPVRSARTTDPKILVQFNQQPLLAYSGASNQVIRAVDEAGVISLVEGDPAKGFSRDDTRSVPHNLFADTGPLWEAGVDRAEGEGGPRAVFTYDEDQPEKAKKAGEAIIEFSDLATATWRWEGGRWVRYLDGSPMLQEDGSPIVADNIVIQKVRTTESPFVDVLGYHSPEVKVTGKGRVWVLRDGKVIAGLWERPDESDLTTFTGGDGQTIALTPGRTYVELAPIGYISSEITIGGKAVGGKPKSDT